MIPAELMWLFWDVDPATIDLDRHRDYVIERIMTRGNWLAMRWLVDHIDDLACMKLSAIAGRGATRDFWDLHTIVTRTGRPLREFLDAFTRKYPVEDIGHVVRSLVYFGDASGPLPAGLTAERWEAIQRDFEAWVRALIPSASR